MPETEPNEIFYTSKYTHGVDDKRRLQVPSKWRPANGVIEYTLVLWPNGPEAEACVSVLPPAAWDSLVKKLKDMSHSDQKALSLRRTIGESSDRVALDGSGRITLSEEMAKAAGIKREAKLVGLVDRFEIWNPERYENARVVDKAIFNEAFKMI